MSPATSLTALAALRRSDVRHTLPPLNLAGRRHSVNPGPGRSAPAIGHSSPRPLCSSAASSLGLRPSAPWAISGSVACHRRWSAGSLLASTRSAVTLRAICRAQLLCLVTSAAISLCRSDARPLCRQLASVSASVSVPTCSTAQTLRSALLALGIGSDRWFGYMTLNWLIAQHLQSSDVTVLGRSSPRMLQPSAALALASGHFLRLVVPALSRPCVSSLTYGPGVLAICCSGSQPM